MAIPEPILLLGVVFFSALLVSCLLYFIGLKSAPKIQETGDMLNKFAPYACGEDMPAKKFQVNIERFFLYGIFFMIFDSSVFFLALSFGISSIYPIIFNLIILSILLIVIPVVGGKRG